MLEVYFMQDVTEQWLETLKSGNSYATVTIENGVFRQVQRIHWQTYSNFIALYHWNIAYLQHNGGNNRQNDIANTRCIQS